MTESDIEFYATEDTPEEDAPEEVWEAWKIQSNQAADWCGANIIRSKHEIAQAKQIMDERIARAKEHFASVERREQFTIDRMENKLLVWHNTWLKPNGLVDDKRKTYSNLETVNVGTHAGGLKLVVDDEPALVAWLEQDDKLAEVCVKVEKTVRKDELKKVLPEVKGKTELLAGDEIVPGAHYERADHSFVVKPK